MADLAYFQCITMATFNSAGLTGTYQALNGTGFSDNIKVLKIYNGSNSGFTVSYDGVADHDFYPPNSTFVLDLQTNHASQGTYGKGTLGGRKGQIIYGKGGAGSGSFYIIGYM